tara:strand:+ start:7596 stop:8462 length:867 start_codon:yes stop_codon:yes gene_type:complete
MGFQKYAHHFGQGVLLSKSMLLRLGIVLYGFRVSVQQVYDLGLPGITIGLLIVILTLFLAVLLGKKLFRLDNELSLLIGAGSAICGAAAILATESITKAGSEKVSVAVATVVIFGTISMFAYPLIFPFLGMDVKNYGVFIGSTIHEVAQVVAAANAIGGVAAETAIIEKMFRVILLVPFLFMLLILGGTPTNATAHKGVKKIPVPWFAVFFLLVIGINSVWQPPSHIIAAIIKIDDFLLAMAMVSLGLSTHFASIRRVGAKPFGLAAMLFIFLTAGGYAINLTVNNIF